MDDDHVRSPHQGEQAVLHTLHFGYPVVLLVVFLVAFMAHSIKTAPKDATLEPAKGLHGPGGKPLPKTKKRGPSAHREILKNDFSPAKKAVFNWLSVVLLLTFVASAAVVIVHALAHRKDQWWCGAHVVVYVVGSLTVFALVLVSLLDSAPSPTWAHSTSWLTALAMEFLILGVSAAYYSGTHREPSVRDRDPSKKEPQGYKFGAIRDGMTRWEALEIAVGLARIVILLALLAFWIYFSWARANDLYARQAAQHDPEETTALLNGHGCKMPNGLEYGSMHHARLNGNGRSTPKEEQCEEGWKRPDKAPARSWYEYVRGYHIFFPYLWPSKSPRLQLMVVLCFLLVIAQRVVNLLVPKQVGTIVDSFTNNEHEIPWVPIGVYLVLRVLQGQTGLLGALRNILWIPVNQYSYRELSTAAFEHVHSLSLDFHLNKKTGEVISALNKGGAINTFLESLTFNLIPMVIDMFIAVGYFLIEFDAYYALVLFIMTISYLYLTIRFSQWRADKRRQMVNFDREEEAVKNDSLVSYESVKYFNAEEREFKKYRDAVKNYQSAEYMVDFSLQALNICQMSVFTIAVMITCFIAAYQVVVGIQTVGKFTTLLTFMAQLQGPLNYFGSFYRSLQSSMINAERLLELFKEQPTVVDEPDAQDLVECRGEIQANDIEFAYDARNPALKGVTFRCAPGTTTALVGESGGGKSTMFKLLYRFYDLMGGNIEVDGHDIRNLTIDSLRQHIGVVPQDTVLFNDTIMYNLKYANPDATDDEVYAAARAACIHDRILAFSDGYDSKVGERGLKLSGGEKQRVAIARAILKNPRIILLDEATAALDVNTEHQVQLALQALATNRTTLVIAHRLSTITEVDQILVLHNGKIVEAGNHEELLEKNGRYATLWRRQSRADRADEEARYHTDKARRLREELHGDASASQSEDEACGLSTAKIIADKKGHRKQASSLATTACDNDSNDGDSIDHK